VVRQDTAAGGHVPIGVAVDEDALRERCDGQEHDGGGARDGEIDRRPLSRRRGQARVEWLRGGDRIGPLERERLQGPGLGFASSPMDRDGYAPLEIAA
jgi:hypothetical protein